jgi:outer membrane protein assembly factor BamB
MKEDTLQYDRLKSILSCLFIGNGKKKWVKKIRDITSIHSIIEDEERYYLSCETDDITGKYLALDKSDGTTAWLIPGRAFINVLYEENLYLIFADEDNLFYLLKIDKTEGNKIWHHKVDTDLAEYSFTARRIQLDYHSGKKEILSPATGRLL